jgi:ATP-dependent DNA ligase
MRAGYTDRVDLPVVPPVTPMLARLARELPADGFLYEPKWDGFRCLAYRSGPAVDLRSRNDRPLARYFPELVDALTSLPKDRFVLDGEVLVTTGGTFDFQALMSRLHPAPSRVERLRREAPARLVLFDLIGAGRRDLRAEPFAERRRQLGRLLNGASPPLHITPITGDRRRALDWLERFHGGGVDGVVAKHRDLPYEPGARAMVKVKHERTADCVVGGFRWLVDRPLPSSLLLGLYDADGVLHHVGMATAFAERRRRDLLEELRPLVVPLQHHPWRHGFLTGGSPLGRLKGAAGRWTPDMGLDWVPLRPDLVCEVAFDQVDVDRFRHPARFRRWRPDRDPGSCRLDQLEVPPVPPGEVLRSA